MGHFYAYTGICGVIKGMSVIISKDTLCRSSPLPQPLALWSFRLR